MCPRLLDQGGGASNWCITGDPGVWGSKASQATLVSDTHIHQGPEAVKPIILLDNISNGHINILDRENKISDVMDLLFGPKELILWDPTVSSRSDFVERVFTIG